MASATFPCSLTSVKPVRPISRDGRKTPAAWRCPRASLGIVDDLDEPGGGTVDRAAVERAFADIAEQETAIGARLLDHLGSRNDARVIGRRRSGPDRVPTISFEVEGRDSAGSVSTVDRHELGIRFGDVHSRRLVERLGLSGDGGVVRVSTVHYDTLDEVDRLVAAVDEALRRGAPP